MNKIIEAIEFFNKVEIIVEDVSTEKDKNNNQKVVFVKYIYENKEYTTKKLYYKDISYADHVRDKNSLNNHFGKPVYWLDIDVHEWPKPSGESDLNKLVVEDIYEGQKPDFKSFLLKLANNSKTGYIQTITEEGRTAQYHHNLENNNHWHDLVLLIKAYIDSKGKDIDEKYFSSLIFKWQDGERTSLSKHFGSRKLIHDLQKNIKLAFKELNKMENQILQILETNKNIVLTGAPGTGKTYLAKEIIAKKITDADKIELVQFHPSYDYTDFVEGLRPTTPDESGNIGFELKNGVFKAFCKRAITENITHNVDNFEMVWDKLLLLIKDNLANGKLTKIGSWEYSLSSKNSLKYSSENTPSQYSFTITRQNVYDAYKNIKARPSGAFQKDMEDVVDFMKQNLQLKDYQQGTIADNTSSRKKYVFIIDEINRAEISKVFGELFFAIDPGYRGETGKVKTQYSNLQTNETIFDDELGQGWFYIPENVYIIGTMNDIDRSVESFDFAMRRRFAWIEVKAIDRVEMWNGQIEVFKEEAEKRMINLNNAIYNEETKIGIDGLNSSYHIGPAYFLKLNYYKENAFQKLWDNHIQILIAEYLRGFPDADEKIKQLKSEYDKQ